MGTHSCAHWPGNTAHLSLADKQSGKKREVRHKRCANFALVTVATDVAFSLTPSTWATPTAAADLWAAELATPPRATPGPRWPWGLTLAASGFRPG